LLLFLFGVGLAQLTSLARVVVFFNLYFSSSPLRCSPSLRQGMQRGSRRAKGREGFSGIVVSILRNIPAFAGLDARVRWLTLRVLRVLVPKKLASIPLTLALVP